jgi:2-polyprenyl-6-hydroxyphenyl methylase/3-demethylubiquinone-9 3-methyltransferase
MEALLYENIYKTKDQFSFWKNWRHFLNILNPEKIQDAKNSLMDFLWWEDKIKWKTFIDVWCGSWLFSLSAYLLWAKRIVSVDIDDNSVWCAEYLRDKEWNPKNWDIVTGSALDKKFIDWLWKYDIVYSRWVLHHTWNMYKAFDNVINLIDDKWIFFLAIYNKFISSKVWWYIKYLYNKTPNVLKFIWIMLHYIYVAIMYLIQWKCVVNEMNKYKWRWMDFHTDIIDWLWWFPYDYMTTKEATKYFNRFWLKPIKIKEANGPSCWEMLFKKL